MPKLTLIELVQDIMNDMDSDEVNSISDTEEALQVAQIVKTTYFEMMGRRDWPHLSKLSTLGSLADSDKPTHLSTPDNLVRLDWFKYNKLKESGGRNYYEDVEYLHPDEFINKTNSRNTTSSNVQTIVGFDSATFQIYNDRQPTYYTSFDDDFIILDSFDSAIESTIQGGSCQVRMYTIPSWTHTDTFTPDLPMEAFPALLAEAKSVASYKLNDESDEKAEQQSVRQQKRLSLNGWSVHGGIRYQDYGRHRGNASTSQRNAGTGSGPTNPDIWP